MSGGKILVSHVAKYKNALRWPLCAVITKIVQKYPDLLASASPLTYHQVAWLPKESLQLDRRFSFYLKLIHEASISLQHRADQLVPVWATSRRSRRFFERALPIRDLGSQGASERLASGDLSFR